MSIRYAAIIFGLWVLSGSACEQPKSITKNTQPSTNTPVPQSTQSSSSTENDEEKMRQDFKKEVVNKDKGTLLFNTQLTAHYSGRIPKSAVLLDDPESRKFFVPFFKAAASLGTAFIEKLPTSLKDQLTLHKVPNKNVDITWVVEASDLLGEAEDHNGIPMTTRISIHGWADPDALGAYTGTRVNRAFLLGVFDSDRDIKTPDLPYETLGPSIVHTHDGVFSPRVTTNMVTIGADDPSQSLWILAIDDQNPDGEIRALATLLWVLNYDGRKEFEKLSLTKKQTSATSWTELPSFTTFGELLTRLNDSPTFKNTKMLQKLDNLFN